MEKSDFYRYYCCYKFLTNDGILLPTCTIKFPHFHLEMESSCEKKIVRAYPDLAGKISIVSNNILFEMKNVK